jgi:hypothetical protein
VYSNASTTPDYVHHWSAFFEAIEAATGKPFQLKLVHGTNSRLIAVVTDAEIAQAQGLAKALLRTPGVDTTRFRDPLDILPCALVTCQVHFNRSVRLPYQ